MEPPELGIMLYPSTLNCTFIFMMNLKEFSYNQIMFYEATEERKTEAVQAIYQGKPLDQKGDSLDEISSTLTKDINAFHYPFDFYDLPTKFEVEMIEILRNRLKATVVDYDNFGNEITAYDQIEIIMIVDPSVTPILGEEPVLIPKPVVIDFQEIRESNVTETLQHLYLDTQNINYQTTNAQQYLNSISNYELKYGNFGTTIESKLNEIITKYFNGDLDEELNQLDILRDSILVDEVDIDEVWPTNTIINNAISAFPGLINDLGASVHLNLYWNNI
jgi:hypothetical protein